MPKPRQTKIAKVQALLERPSGANLKTICKATGWQPHSSRAALTGLRKAGHVIERNMAKGEIGGSAYHIVPVPEQNR